VGVVHPSLSLFLSSSHTLCLPSLAAAHGLVRAGTTQGVPRQAVILLYRLLLSHTTSFHQVIQPTGLAGFKAYLITQ
jgi:hypothetical protein